MGIVSLLAVISTASAAADDSLAPASLRASRGSLVQLERQGLKFELFLPKAWKPSAAATPAPVLVFLHGRGESGGFGVTNAQSLPLQLLTNRSFTESFPFITIVPQCPHHCAMANHWLATTLQSITSLLHDWVLAPADGGGLGGDRSRVYLAGQSMGGHGAWTYAAQQPRLFAGLVVVCGYLQGNHQTRTVSSRLAHAALPVAVYHSADDVVIPVAAADQVVHALRQDGYEGGGGGGGGGGAAAKGPLPLKFVRYDHAPGPPMPEFAELTGHGSYELAFRDAALYTWLLEHRCAKCEVRPPAAWRGLDTHDESDL